MSDARMIEGGCLCGAIRYCITGEPRVSTLCHCRSCRRASGGPTLAWLVLNTSDVQFIAGTPARFRSSDTVIRQFCARCGTQLIYQSDTKPDSLDITTANLDQPDIFPPTRKIWLEHRISWESTNEAADHYAGSSAGATPVRKPDAGPIR